MEQQKANMRTADQKHHNSTTVALQNCNSKQHEEESSVDCNIKVFQKHLVSSAAGHQHNLDVNVSACSAGEDQTLPYGCNTEKTSSANRESEMADIGISHGQYRTANPTFAENVTAPAKIDKGPLAFNSETGQAEVSGTQHTAQQSTIYQNQSSSDSTATKATDADHRHPVGLLPVRTSPLMCSAQSDVQEVVQQPCTPTVATSGARFGESKNAIDETTKQGLAISKEERISSCTNAAEKDGQPSRLPSYTGSGTRNHSDDDDGYPPESLQQPSLIAVTISNPTFPEETPVSSIDSEHLQAAQASQLSSECVNCTGSPKSVLSGNTCSRSEGQEIVTFALDGHHLSSVAVCYDFSNEVPKVISDGLYMPSTQGPAEESHVVVCSSSDVLIKKGDCAKHMHVTSQQDQQLDQSCVLLQTNKCTNSEGLHTNQPTDPNHNKDCLSQQEFIPAEHKVSQIVCLRNSFSTQGNINVDEKQDEGAEVISGLNTVEVKDFIDVGILMQPGMEDTWLVVSESSAVIDGSCEGPENAGIIDVNPETVVHCPESATSVVYQCTVPCFPTENIQENVKLLLTEKKVEDLKEKQSLDPSTEALNEESKTLLCHSPALQDFSSLPDSVTASENMCMQDMIPNPTCCPGVENTISGLDSTLISHSSTGQEEQVKATEHKIDLSQISLSSAVIDPKFLILKKNESPFLVHPPMLAKLSGKQSLPVQPGTHGDGSVEKAIDFEAENRLSSPSTSPELNTTDSVTESPLQSKPKSLIRLEHSSVYQRPVSQCEPLSDSTTSTPVQPLTCLQSRSSSVCSQVTEQKLCHEDQPCPFSMSLGGELEVEENCSLAYQFTNAKDTSLNTLVQLDATVEESSDGEADSSMEAHTNDNIIHDPAQNKHGQSRTDKQAFLMKVREWIAGRGTTGSSSSTSRTPSPPSALSTGDWNQAHSLICSSHDKDTLPSLQCSSETSVEPQSDQSLSQRPRLEKGSDMAELAKHEAEIEHRTLSLKREGFWSLKRLSRVAEPVRPKVHWDYLCEEMQWLSADFAQERRWKRGVARKVVRMVMRHHEEIRQKEERAKREEQAKLRRIAASIAKEVRSFWSSVEKVVQYKQQSRLEEKRKKALDLQLDFIVGQTERYSDLLSQSLQATPAATTVPSRYNHPNVTEEDDMDFEPPCEEEEEGDDEETIEVEEQQDGNDAETQRKEIELLRQESTLPLDQLLSTLSLPQGSALEEETSDDASSAIEDEDKEFLANEEDAEDVEDTIAAQEVIEGEGGHAEELDDLAKEGEMSVEELLEKYRGAYSSDFKEPLESEFSDESDATEEEEEDTERDDSNDRSSVSSGSVEQSEDEATEAEESEEEDDGGEGMEVLLREGDHSPSTSTSSRPKKEISHIAATAESLQPKGYTLATTSVKTPIPFLLHGSLREYQHIGLDWLVTMYEKKLNGILADEMGLGKTIQTIALLAHLACEKGNWGPHLIIVPTSVMLNWEMELKRWCPGFKILTYYGSQKERKLKRQGWTKPNAFHVCITSYKLVLQDHQAFRRKSWKYLILDEAQNIKNFKSQRWQSLLNFNSHRRLLLTGTPLQNSLMELWSLMHFLMPHVFQSHREFKEWFSNPLTGMIEGSQEYNEGLVKRLHKVLRPFLLRRIKVDVEKQMPKKYEHVIRCRLSKRQRFLYDDFMAQASTKETLASGHFMSVINILMQLRKVCNHPNLFDPRPIQSPFITEPVVYSTASLVLQALDRSPFQCCDFSMFDLVSLEGCTTRYQAEYLPQRKVTRQLIQEIMESPEPQPRPKPVRIKVNRMFQPLPKSDGRSAVTASNVQPTSSVASPVHPPKVPLKSEVTPAPAQSATPVCPVIPAPRGVVCQSGSTTQNTTPVTNIRPPPHSSALTVSASPQPSNVVTQRVLLSPDMQARLPSGEVVSIAQLASMAGRPMSSSQGSKPVTFQLQGNKLTLSGTTSVPQPQSIQAPSSRVSGPGIVKIVVRQAQGKEGGQVPTLAVSPSVRVASPQSVLLHPHGTPSPALRLPTPQVSHQRPPVYSSLTQTSASSPVQPPPTRPVLKVVEGTTQNPVQTKVNASLSNKESSTEVTQPVSSNKQTPAARNSKLIAQRPKLHPPPRSPFHVSWLEDCHKAHRDAKISQIFRINELHCSTKPVYGREVLDFLSFLPGSNPTPAHPILNRWNHSGYSSCLIAQTQHVSNHLNKSRALQKAIQNSEDRLQLLSEVIDRFTFVIPPVEAKQITMHCCHPPPSLNHQQTIFTSMLTAAVSPLTHTLHRIQCNMRTHFPDLRLIQYDCGKLQTLHLLLRKLKTGSHRVLIFTQMTRMLDVLEQFLNYHGHIYLRLDGSTRVEQRQALMERFNADRRIFCFILSTRSGGVGVNLTGADTVVFYDSDWNPTMDAQAQDRCHRIGQTRDVHIYRLISERTVEENILKKANQKRMLGDMAIEGGNFTTAFFKEQTIRELFDMCEAEKKENESNLPPIEDEEAVNKQQTVILEQALCRAEDEEDIVAASQAKAEQVAELAEFNENIPLDDGDSRDQEEEELSKAEQEIAALVEQLTPIERYAMNFLEASLEDICKEELKQAEEQVEAARKGLDQAKEEGLKLHQSSDNDEEDSMQHSPEEHHLARRTRKQKEKGAPSTRVSFRLRGTPAKICDDASPPTDQEKVKKREKPKSMTSLDCAEVSSPSPQSPQPKDVSERLRGGLRGKGINKEHVVSTQEEDQKPKTNLTSEPETHFFSRQLSVSRDAPSQTQPSLSSHISPLLASSAHVDRNSGNSASASTTIFCEMVSEHEAAVQSPNSLQNIGESIPSVSVDSICSSEQMPEPNSQHSPVVSPTCPHPRSPRKRQSADGEVLKGLPEDSPSAKVLRKLPGRLVTVVEDKEPKRRKRGESCSAGVHNEGSSEESESTKDATPHSPVLQGQSPKDNTLPKSPPLSPSQMLPGQEQILQPLHPSPGRSYHPYSPTHHSPDMPVLRNLPVRRRLETESRMAAQLGEHFVSKGRGLDRRTPLSPKKQEPNLPKESTSPTNVSGSSTSLVPVKRKRGRPPRIQPKATETPEQDTHVQKSQVEMQSSPQSPKRKRGRPRKISTTHIVDIEKPVNEAGCSNVSPSVSQKSISFVNSNSLSDKSPVSDCPVVSSPVNVLSTSSISSETPKTKPQTIPFTTSSETCESNLNLISPQNLPSENTSLKAQLSALQTVSHLSQQEVVVQQDNTSTSHLQQPLCERSCSSPLNSFQNPESFCKISASQSSLVSTVCSDPSNVSVKDTTMQLAMESNQCIANQQILTTPKCVPQSCSKSNETNKPTNVQTFGESTSEVVLTTSIKPVAELGQPSGVLAVPLQTTLTPNSSETASSQFQVKPEQTKVAASNLKQNTTASVSSPETTDKTGEVCHYLHSTSQIIIDGPQCTTDKFEPQNQHDSSELRKEKLLQSSDEIKVNHLDKLNDEEKTIFLSQGKRKKQDLLQESQVSETTSVSETVMLIVPEARSIKVKSNADLQERKNLVKKRYISRQSSQESVRSSSPSSISSCNTCSTQCKKADDGRPTKRIRVEKYSEKQGADKETDEEPVTPDRRPSSNFSSSDSEDSVQEMRLTRSSHKRLEKETNNDEDKSKNKQRSDKKSTKAKLLRVTRNSTGSQSASQLVTPTSPEPEVLSKRCSALNAAAKLLAMRGPAQESPSSTTKSKVTQEQQPASEKIRVQSKDKTVQDSSKANSFEKIGGQQIPARSTESPQCTTDSASRSTRQRPGNLVSPLELDAKRTKKEERKMASGQKQDGEDEHRETRSSRGHSACSSISSERGPGSSRSRSSSNSSRCTRSLSSRSTGRLHSHSRAPSSGSDNERGKFKLNKMDKRGRNSKWERRSQKYDKTELSAGSSEGTPDRMLRSVAALAAAQARTPANNTRSSTSQKRLSKT